MFDKNLKQLRKDNKLTQKQLSQSLCVKVSTVTAWETGKKMPNNEMLIKISNLFKVSVDELIGNKSNSINTKSHNDPREELKNTILELSKQEQVVMEELLKYVLVTNNLKKILEVLDDTKQTEVRNYIEYVMNIKLSDKSSLCDCVYLLDVPQRQVLYKYVNVMILNNYSLDWIDSPINITSGEVECLKVLADLITEQIK